MKLTKEDYMRLPKERLAELLVELDDRIVTIPLPEIKAHEPPCYGPNGICRNPHMDCINCPRMNTGKVYTSPNTASGISKLKAEW